jgi:hypothetical protein
MFSKTIFSKTIYSLSLICALGLLFLSGCATLDQSECQSADWQIIGLEDGALGKPTSFIGRHRSACAEYAIAPDLSAYLKGHNKGLKQYCTYQQGFNLGLRGQQLNPVCESVNRQQFSQGHQRGLSHYQLLQQIKILEQQVVELQNELEQKQRLITQKENQIVNGQTSNTERRQLLHEIKGLTHEVQALQVELNHVERELFIAEERYETFRRAS